MRPNSVSVRASGSVCRSPKCDTRPPRRSSRRVAVVSHAMCLSRELVVARRHLFAQNLVRESPVGQVAPDLSCLDHIAHARRKFVRRVVMLPAAAAVQFGEVGKPPIGEIAPFPRNLVQAVTALHGWHRWSEARAESSNARSTMNRRRPSVAQTTPTHSVDNSDGVS